MQLSRKISLIAPSPTLALNAKAKEMIAQGIKVLNFSVGEPDFNTPENIIQAAREAMDKGYTRYTAASGLPELKDAISRKFKEDNGIDYDPSEIVVGSGAKPLLYGALKALCEPGDEVIYASPYWVSYPEIIKLVDAKPVIVEALEKDDFEIKASEIAKKITSATKAIILNSPCNPTGAVISVDELNKIADLAVENDLFVISDEIYEKLVYDTEFVSIASLNSAIWNRTVTINGSSKAYAMTGWRIGYMGAPLAISKGITNFLSHITGNPNTIAQKAFVEALNGPQDTVEKMKNEFHKRRDVFIKGLNSIKGITCVNPHGAFYVYPNFSKLFSAEIPDSTIMAEYLLEKVHIAAMPGIAFGTDEHIRFSYAASIEDIEECITRLKSIFG